MNLGIAVRGNFHLKQTPQNICRTQPHKIHLEDHILGNLNLSKRG